MRTQNCQTFQKDMKTALNLHFQSAEGFLEDPQAMGKAQAKAESARIAQEREAARQQEASAALKLVKGQRRWEARQAETPLRALTADGAETQVKAKSTFCFTHEAPRKISGEDCHEVVTDIGERGWVPDAEVRARCNNLANDNDSSEWASFKGWRRSEGADVHPRR